MELNELSNFELSSVAVESEERGVVCVCVCVYVTTPRKEPGNYCPLVLAFVGTAF